MCKAICLLSCIARGWLVPSRTAAVSNACRGHQETHRGRPCVNVGLQGRSVRHGPSPVGHVKPSRWNHDPRSLGKSAASAQALSAPQQRLTREESAQASDYLSTALRVYPRLCSLDNRVGSGTRVTLAGIGADDVAAAGDTEVAPHPVCARGAGEGRGKGGGSGGKREQAGLRKTIVRESRVPRRPKGKLTGGCLDFNLARSGDGGGRDEGN